MKATCAAILLSCITATLPVYAVTKAEKPPEKQVSAITKIDINHADLAKLTGSFKGIGKKRAEAIIAYRESHKGFKSLEELAEVKGFGQHFVVKNREQLKTIFAVN